MINTKDSCYPKSECTDLGWLEKQRDGSWSDWWNNSKARGMHIKNVENYYKLLTGTIVKNEDEQKYIDNVKNFVENPNNNDEQKFAKMESLLPPLLKLGTRDYEGRITYIPDVFCLSKNCRVTNTIEKKKLDNLTKDAIIGKLERKLGIANDELNKNNLDNELWMNWWNEYKNADDVKRHELASKQPPSDNVSQYWKKQILDLEEQITISRNNGNSNCNYSNGVTWENDHKKNLLRSEVEGMDGYQCATLCELNSKAKTRKGCGGNPCCQAWVEGEELKNGTLNYDKKELGRLAKILKDKNKKFRKLKASGKRPNARDEQTYSEVTQQINELLGYELSGDLWCSCCETYTTIRFTFNLVELQRQISSVKCYLEKQTAMARCEYFSKPKRIQRIIAHNNGFSSNVAGINEYALHLGETPLIIFNPITQIPFEQNELDLFQSKFNETMKSFTNTWKNAYAINGTLPQNALIVGEYVTKKLKEISYRTKQIGVPVASTIGLQIAIVSDVLGYGAFSASTSLAATGIAASVPLLLQIAGAAYLSSTILSLISLFMVGDKQEPSRTITKKEYASCVWRNLTAYAMLCIVSAPPGVGELPGKLSSLGSGTYNVELMNNATLWPLVVEGGVVPTFIKSVKSTAEALNNILTSISPDTDSDTLYKILNVLYQEWINPFDYIGSSSDNEMEKLAKIENNRLMQSQAKANELAKLENSGLLSMVVTGNGALAYQMKLLSEKSNRDGLLIDSGYSISLAQLIKQSEDVRVAIMDVKIQAGIDEHYASNPIVQKLLKTSCGLGISLEEEQDKCSRLKCCDAEENSKFCKEKGCPSGARELKEKLRDYQEHVYDSFESCIPGQQMNASGHCVAAAAAAAGGGKYSYITNPLTGRKVNVNGKLGIKILKNYLKMIN